MAAMVKREPAYIGLGANMASPRWALAQAVAALEALPGVALGDVSALYRTPPVGPVAQEDFYNAVVSLHVPAAGRPEEGAMALLTALKGIERAMGRVPRQRWGPREVDLDLLLLGPHQIRVEREAMARSADPERDGVQWLEVPHPSASGRLFVLAPLADLAPDLEPPGWDMSVAGARDRALAAEGADAAIRIAEWDHAERRWVDS